MSPNSQPFSFLSLNLSTSNFCSASLLTANNSLTFENTREWSVSQSAPLKDRTSSIFECHLLSINIWSILFWVFLSRLVQMYEWMFRRVNILALTARYFEVGKVTILTLLSLQSWCRLSFPIVGLEISSLPSFVLKTPNRNIIWYLGKYKVVQIWPGHMRLVYTEISPGHIWTTL